MSRRRKKFVGSAAAIVMVAAGVAGYWRHRANAALADVLPVFVEPAAGPRAPAARFFGFAVGRTRLEEAQSAATQLGLTCTDTSMRALMRQLRAEKQREIDETRARGEDVDNVTGASAVRRRSPKEANPQVRLACDDVPSDRFLDRGRPASRGRLLLVFDSPKHPLRHVSFERTFPATAAAAALEDVLSSRRALARALGVPRANAAGPSAEPTELEWLKPTDAEWSFSDLRARVSAINYGPRGIVVSELAEVPWPVRADATARP